MHADLDYFYAQCEEIANPTIRGKPVVVCVYSGRTEDSGVVSTCNYDARKFGVKAGVPIVRAKKLMERTEAVFLPVNRPLYEKVSERIMNILGRYADNFERVGIDEAYLDLSKSLNEDFTQAKATALRIKEEILQSEHITCSIGIGPNKLIAKIASDENKPNGLTLISLQDAKSFLAELGVSRIPGVGKKAEEKLSQLHVSTVNELSGIDSNTLVETFGRSLGSYLYHAARAEDDEPVKSRDQPTQISRIATLKRSTSNAAEIMPILAELTHSVAERLVQENLRCKSVGIIVITDTLKTHAKSKTLESLTSDEDALKQNSNELLQQFLQTARDVTIRRVGVKLSELSKIDGQANLKQFLS
jgi:DNA polymerase IV (DinB-like DNA polymerase)